MFCIISDNILVALSKINKNIFDISEKIDIESKLWGKSHPTNINWDAVHNATDFAQYIEWKLNTTDKNILPTFIKAKI